MCFIEKITSDFSQPFFRGTFADNEINGDNTTHGVASEGRKFNTRY